MNGQAEQLTLFGQDIWSGKMFQWFSVPGSPAARTSASFWRKPRGGQRPLEDVLFLPR